MIDLTTYLLKVSSAKSAQELWPFLTAAMEEFGFDRLIYGYTPYRSGSSLGDPRDWRILTNHSPAYMEGFVQRGLYAKAPMVEWSLSNVGACSWSLIEKLCHDKKLTKDQKAVVAFNRSMEVHAGYTISFRSISSRGKGAMALAARKSLSQQEVDQMWETHGDTIVAMNNVAHLRLLTLPFDGARQLTRRQLEVLEWVSDGKSMQDVATILGVSTATVEKHLRLARLALDVDTTAQAVSKAASLNQMFTALTD